MSTEKGPPHDRETAPSYDSSKPDQSSHSYPLPPSAYPDRYALSGSVSATFLSCAEKLFQLKGNDYAHNDSSGDHNYRFQR